MSLCFPPHIHISSLKRLYATAIRRLSTSAIDRLKNPTRGGQNLSERYRQLERSLRGKEALSYAIDNLTTTPSPGTTRSRKRAVEMFQGLVVPVKPRPPEADGAFELSPDSPPAFVCGSRSLES
jgi:hypothetical protein